MKKTVLLVQPDYPIPPKRKVHHDFFPIGLLKIGTFLKHAKGCEVELVFGKKKPKEDPDEIWISSLFTYWSEYVHDCARFYRGAFPEAKLKIGGIYATLMPENVRKETGARVHKGVFQTAEDWALKHGVDYSLLGRDIDFQILHGMRGCFRRCKFCGTWRIEPKEEFNTKIPSLISKNHVVFYDNNFLRNPDIKPLLRELSDVRVNGRPVVYECQSGFDGRIMDQEIVNLLKKARFINPRIAWDNSFDDAPKIREQISMLRNAGYNAKDIYVFVLYNWRYDYRTMERKRLKCWSWRVQISDCRFRPLDQLFDRYDPRKAQTNSDYFIHENWTDEQVKLFRANVRRHNICVRHGFRFHSRKLEQMRVSKKRVAEINAMSKNEIKSVLRDAWFPEEFHRQSASQSRLEQY